MPSLVEIGPVVLEKKIKSLRTDGRQAIRKAHLSLRLRRVKKKGRPADLSDTDVVAHFEKEKLHAL